MARKTNIDVTDVTLFTAADYFGITKSVNFDWEVMTAPGRSVATRHQSAVPAKKKLVFTVEEMVTSTTRQTNLNVTVYTIGGTAYLGRLRSGSLKVTTDAKEGSGLADLWEFPYAVGTDLEVTGEIQIASAASFAAIIAAAGTSGLLVTVAISLGGSVFAGPMTLTKSSHKISEGEIQTESISLKANGLPTTTTGNLCLASVTLGTALVAYSVASGANTVSGAGLIMDTNIQFNDAAIIAASHTIANQGTPTYA